MKGMPREQKRKRQREEGKKRQDEGEEEEQKRGGGDIYIYILYILSIHNDQSRDSKTTRNKGKRKGQHLFSLPPPIHSCPFNLQP